MHLCVIGQREKTSRWAWPGQQMVPPGSWLYNGMAVQADESECRAARASVQACTVLARNRPQRRSVSTDDMALPSATGTPMEIHLAGMPHSLVRVRTGTKYLVASENIDPLPQQQCSSTVLQRSSND